MNFNQLSHSIILRNLTSTLFKNLIKDQTLLRYPTIMDGQLKRIYGM